MRLVIKGSPKNAKREAARRGIAVRNCHKNPKRNETYCDASDSARGRAVQWLHRGGETSKPGRGVPPGSLLLFNGARRKRRRRR